MKLDSNLATKFEHGYLLILEPAKELADFPEVYDRICWYREFIEATLSDVEQYGVCYI